MKRKNKTKKEKIKEEVKPLKNVLKDEKMVKKKEKQKDNLKKIAPIVFAVFLLAGGLVFILTKLYTIKFY